MTVTVTVTVILQRVLWLLTDPSPSPLLLLPSSLFSLLSPQGGFTDVPGIGTQSSRLMFTHEGRRLLVLDSFCRSISQFDVVYNHSIQLDNHAQQLAAAQRKATAPIPGGLPAPAAVENA